MIFGFPCIMPRRWVCGRLGDKPIGRQDYWEKDHWEKDDWATKYVLGDSSKDDWATPINYLIYIKLSPDFCIKYYCSTW